MIVGHGHRVHQRHHVIGHGGIALPHQREERMIPCRTLKAAVFWGRLRFHSLRDGGKHLAQHVHHLVVGRLRIDREFRLWRFKRHRFTPSGLSCGSALWMA